MKKIFLVLIFSFVFSGNVFAENKHNHHLENKFESYLPCDEHVAVLFKKIKKSSPRDYPYLFPENKLVSCNPEINLPNEWVKTITPIKKFGKVNRDQSRVRAYPFAGSISGYQVGNLNKGEVIFIDSLVYNSWEKADEWYRSWYSFKIKDDIFYIWKGSIDLND